MIWIIRTITASFFLVVIGIIFIADTNSTRFVLNFVGDIPFGDKLGHFFIFGILSSLLNWSLNFRRTSIFLLGSVLIGIFALLEEGSQIFIRGRTFDFFDLVADFGGIFILPELVFRFISFSKKA